jgi:pimeloyl-ACP methyl ester carboxylesterase
MLLIMGLGGPMTWWDPDFCQRLADRGFYVTRYDNRDTGRSSRLDGRVTKGAMVRSFLGRKVRAPYSMDDLAEDGFALLDHLGVGPAHLVGISMGGMIAQTMTVNDPERVLSLTSIMSTTGRRSVGWQDPRLLPMLMARGARTREAYVEGAARVWKMIGSPLYPDTTAAIADRAAETWDRGRWPPSSPSRTGPRGCAGCGCRRW